MGLARVVLAASSLVLALALHAAAALGAVTTEAQLRRAWADPLTTRIDLGSDIVLRDCRNLEPIRESPYPLVLDGHGHTLRQTCFEHRLLRQDGTGHLDLRRVTLTRGGADGPGAAVATRGELVVSDSTVKQNLSEEPGGGLFSMRAVTVRRSHINGNLANDDGGGVYARHGGVKVYDSVISNNLVDGSGGAVGSTGDILVVGSQVDGNTTDGDGGALYADDDGDVTVIRSLIDGSDADGPGGAIFTLDGDVAVFDSTLLGNRADDRGGAISGEADVLLVNSTVARNLAVAHAGGGIWARGNLVLVNTTVTDNYAEGEGGGLLAAGRTTLLWSTISNNISSFAANLGSAGLLRASGSIIGPAKTDETTGDARPSRRSCRLTRAISDGYNFVTDSTCSLGRNPTDTLAADPGLRPLEDDPKGFVLTPFDASPVRARVPRAACVSKLPEPLPAGQLLEAYVDWPRVLARDAVGTPRASGTLCDIGAVQSPPPPAEPPASPTPSPLVGGGASRAVARARAARTPPRSVPPGARRPSAPAPASGALTLRALARRVADVERASRRFDVLRRCTTEVGVDQAGDPAHRFGFRYDERDGSGLDRRPALVLHHGPGRPDLRLLSLRRARACLSAPPDPAGTALPARARASRAADADAVAELRRRTRVVERRAKRFDAWESCLTRLPVTESGDPAQDLGYLREGGTSGRVRHDAAIDVDASARDDPDYELLAFVGDDRPFGRARCDAEPGEGFAGLRRGAASESPRAPAAAGGGLRALAEDVEDVARSVQDITTFDECLFTVGVHARGGYVFEDRRGRLHRRSALAFDLGAGLPQLDVMAFPGEEPPQIECNEDAGDHDDD